MTAQWLRGDFHAHTKYSDGVLSPAEFLREAEREEMDFFAITDHNTWTYPEFDASEVTIVAGVEVTMEYGHFNVFSEDGVEPGWMELLPQPLALRDDSTPPGASRELLDAVAASGLRASINHPLQFPWEWMDDATPLASLQFLEIWNDPTWPENKLTNPAAVEMWTRWLNAGSRITALGGSDFHTPQATDRFDGRVVPGHRVGLPRTYVLAENNPTSILEALDVRRAYVTMGPTIAFHVVAGSARAEIGDDLGMYEGSAHVEATVTAPEWLTIELVRNGIVVEEATGQHTIGISTELVLHGAGWIRLDVRSRDGELLGVTNPVFFGADSSPTDLKYGTFVAETARDLVQQFTRENPI